MKKVRAVGYSSILLYSVVWLVSCSRATLSHPNDLGLGGNSNITSPLGGSIVDKEQIETIKVLPNTRIPKGVFVALFDNAEDGNNDAFIKDLYNTIAGINKADHLLPTLPLSHPSMTDLMEQEISLFVLVTKGHMADYAKVISTITGHPEAESLPYIAPIEIDIAKDDPWIQDFGEFAKVTIKGQPNPAYVVIDVQRNQNRDAYNPDLFMKLFRMPLVKLGANANISGQNGGNIEAMPNGIIYMGDAVDGNVEHPQTGSPLFNQLKALGNPDAIKLPSQWLHVGHIDEFVAFIPSRQGCGSALLYANPLTGLKTILEKSSAEEFQHFATELKDIPILDKDEKKITTLGLELTRQGLRDALNWFRRTPSQKISTNIADYDLQRREAAWASLLDPQGLPLNDFESLKKSPDAMMRFYVWRNLMDQRSIGQSVAALLAKAGCSQNEGLPQPFRPDFMQSYKNENNLIFSGDVAHTPDMVNSLVLRDHVIVPDPGVAALRSAALKALGKHLVPATAQPQSKVHFVNDEAYHVDYGEIHCGTNVVREMDLNWHF